MTMTQRKFKHKQTGWIAEHDKFSEMYKLFNTFAVRKGALPVEMVENSNEWEEITQPELVEGKWYVFNNPYKGKGVGRFNSLKYIDSHNTILLDVCYYKTLVNYEREKIHADWIEREATPEEIHKALDAIRVYNGLVEGVKVETPATKMKFTISEPTEIALDEEIGYALRSRYGAMCIYRPDFGWAQKVEEPILVTEDGFEKCEEDNVYVLVITDSTLPKTIFKEKIEEKDPRENLLYFHYRENAEKHIKNKQLRYSDEDLEWAIKEGCNRFHGAYKMGVANINNITRLVIDNLKNSKDD